MNSVSSSNSNSWNEAKEKREEIVSYDRISIQKSLMASSSSRTNLKSKEKTVKGKKILFLIPQFPHR
jgi:hypothetical protein